MILDVAELDSPVGRLTIAARGHRIVALCFDGLWPDRERRLAKRFDGLRLRASADPAGAASGLALYFGGDLHALDGLEVETAGTPFQEKVWSELRRIPSGTTRTYLELATAIGLPSAVRAVGAANGANPVGIVVPCHRVIGSNGSLTGFAGGLVAKRWLLDHESAQLGVPLAATTPRPAAAA
jgi:methylated-DNA-[protein]-cysteine S-methyltransferase